MAEGTVTFPGFIGGLNRDADPALLTTEEVPNALNIDFGMRGEAIRTKMWSVYSSSSLDEFMDVWQFRSPVNLTDYLIGIEAGIALVDIWWGSGATLTQKTTTMGDFTDLEDYPIGGAAFNDKFYVTGRRGGTKAYRLNAGGGSWTDLTFTVFDGTATNFPEASHLAAHNDVMFAANIDDAGTVIRSRLAWSNILNAEVWEASDFIDFTPDDGQAITALKTFGEDLMVFKNHSVQVLVGRSEASFSRYVLDARLGTASYKTVQQIGGELFFFDRDHGVWSFDGGGFQHVSEPINNYLLDGISYEDSFRASAYVWRDKYYLSVPWAANTVTDRPSRTFVFDIRNRSWSEYSYGMEAATVRQGVAYGVNVGRGNALSNGGIEELHDGYDGVSGAGETQLRTPWVAVGDSMKLNRVDLLMTPSGGSDIFWLDVYVDYDTTPYRSIALSTDAAYTDGFGYFAWTDQVARSIVEGSEQVSMRVGGFGDVRPQAVSVGFRVVQDTAFSFQVNRITVDLTESSKGTAGGQR